MVYLILIYHYTVLVCYLYLWLNTFVLEYLKSDTQEEKESIFTENKGKSGIYCRVNTINGKFYIGSAVNLTTRLRSYYSSSLE